MKVARMNWLVLVLLTSLACARYTPAEEPLPKNPLIAFDHAFPSRPPAKYLSGEVTLVEHVNRLGILRPDRDPTISKYFWDLPLHFQMLPYGSVYLHGALTELDALPIGTHVHTQLYLGPEGEFKVQPPETDYETMLSPTPDLRSIDSKYSRVLRIEDDFTYFRRLGHGWRITKVDLHAQRLEVVRSRIDDGSEVPPEDSIDGFKCEQCLRINDSCDVWMKGQLASVERLAPGMLVQINFSWMQILAENQVDGICTEIWGDEESCQQSIARQLKKHLSNTQLRGVPALIMSTTHKPGEGAQGLLELALCDNADPAAIASMSTLKEFIINPVDRGLRAYHNPGSSTIRNARIDRIDAPPPGHSGIRITAHCNEMLEGYRAGRMVRLLSPAWDRTPLPREHLLSTRDSRSFCITPKIAGRIPQNP